MEPEKALAHVISTFWNLCQISADVCNSHAGPLLEWYLQYSSNPFEALIDIIDGLVPLFVGASRSNLNAICEILLRQCQAWAVKAKLNDPSELAKLRAFKSLCTFGCLENLYLSNSVFKLSEKPSNELVEVARINLETQIGMRDFKTVCSILSVLPMSVERLPFKILVKLVVFMISKHCDAKYLQGMSSDQLEEILKTFDAIFLLPDEAVPARLPEVLGNVELASLLQTQSACNKDIFEEFIESLIKNFGVSAKEYYPCMLLSKKLRIFNLLCIRTFQYRDVDEKTTFRQSVLEMARDDVPFQSRILGYLAQMSGTVNSVEFLKQKFSLDVPAIVPPHSGSAGQTTKNSSILRDGASSSYSYNGLLKKPRMDTLRATDMADVWPNWQQYQLPYRGDIPPQWAAWWSLYQDQVANSWLDQNQWAKRCLPSAYQYPTGQSWISQPPTQSHLYKHRKTNGPGSKEKASTSQPLNIVKSKPPVATRSSSEPWYTLRLPWSRRFQTKSPALLKRCIEEIALSESGKMPGQTSPAVSIRVFTYQNDDGIQVDHIGLAIHDCVYIVDLQAILNSKPSEWPMSQAKIDKEFVYNHLDSLFQADALTKIIFNKSQLEVLEGTLGRKFPLNNVVFLNRLGNMINPMKQTSSDISFEESMLIWTGQTNKKLPEVSESWSSSPLSHKQFEYAAVESYALLDMYFRMNQIQTSVKSPTEKPEDHVDSENVVYDDDDVIIMEDDEDDDADGAEIRQGTNSLQIVPDQPKQADVEVTLLTKPKARESEYCFIVDTSLGEIYVELKRIHLKACISSNLSRKIYSRSNLTPFKAMKAEAIVPYDALIDQHNFSDDNLEVVSVSSSAIKGSVDIPAITKSIVQQLISDQKIRAIRPSFATAPSPEQPVVVYVQNRRYAPYEREIFASIFEASFILLHPSHTNDDPQMETIHGWTVEQLASLISISSGHPSNWLLVTNKTPQSENLLKFAKDQSDKDRLLFVDFEPGAMQGISSYQALMKQLPTEVQEKFARLGKGLQRKTLLTVKTLDRFLQRKPVNPNPDFVIIVQASTSTSIVAAADKNEAKDVSPVYPDEKTL